MQCWNQSAQFLFLERLFNAFDVDSSNSIDLEEFMSGLSVFLKGTPDEKLLLSFRLYDVDNSGSIEPKELIKIMGQLVCMHANRLTVFSYLVSS